LNVAVVAFLSWIDLCVATRIDSRAARPSGGGTSVSRLDIAVLIATIATRLVAIVTPLIAFDDAIAASYGRLTHLVRRRQRWDRGDAAAIGFEFALRVTAIAGNCITVVTSLGLIQNAIAA